MNTEQLRAELLPCPFCGETEGLIIQHCEGTIIHPALRIYCDNCGASSGYSDRVDPVENWNRRAALQSPEIQALKKDAERYRWLRDSGNDDIGVVSGLDCTDSGSSNVVGTYEYILDGEQLDSAIDHARNIVGGKDAISMD